MSTMSDKLAAAAVVPIRAPANDKAAAKDEADEKTPTRTKEAIDFVQREAELFHAPDREPYATVIEGDRFRTMRLGGDEFREWAASGIYSETNRPIGRSSIDEAVMTLRGIARERCPRLPVFLRVGQDPGGAIWLDLGDATGRAVKVTPRGWTIEAEPGVRFRRPSSMLPLHEPERGGSIQLLRNHVNVEDDDGLSLAAGWLLSALRPGFPHPIATFVGPQGTGKTSASRVLKALVDPSAIQVRAMPSSEENIVIAAHNGRVIAFDNLSSLKHDVADALCKVATGGGLGKRKLYADADEAVIHVLAPLILNGISDLNERPDLAERMLMIPLGRIDARQRRDEAALRRGFELDAPKILGALLDGAAAALAGVDEVRLHRMPRMADLAKWVTAAEPALGMASGTFLAAHERQHDQSVIAALESSATATAVRLLGERPTTGGEWAGTPSALLDALRPLVSEEAKRGPTWPKAPNKLTGQLRRDASFLRAVGVTVEFGQDGRGNDRKRWVTIRWGVAQ